MTRGHVNFPIWTWICDRCFRSSGDYERYQQDLPRPEAMREEGWFIAKKWGDLCPECYSAEEDGAR